MNFETALPNVFISIFTAAVYLLMKERSVKLEKSLLEKIKC